MNAFLRQVMADAGLRGQLHAATPEGASQLAQRLGFDVTVGDLVRYKSRATSWQLSDAELAEVSMWQGAQPYWWQYL